jgi:hypothetical protein
LYLTDLDAHPPVLLLNLAHMNIVYSLLYQTAQVSIIILRYIFGLKTLGTVWEKRVVPCACRRLGIIALASFGHVVPIWLLLSLLVLGTLLHVGIVEVLALIELDVRGG